MKYPTFIKKEDLMKWYPNYKKQLAIKQAIAEQRNNIFENYITKHLAFKLCNN